MSSDNGKYVNLADLDVELVSCDFEEHIIYKQQTPDGKGWVGYEEIPADIYLITGSYGDRTIKLNMLVPEINHLSPRAIDDQALDALKQWVARYEKGDPDAQEIFID